MVTKQLVTPGECWCKVSSLSLRQCREDLSSDRVDWQPWPAELSLHASPLQAVTWQSIHTIQHISQKPHFSHNRLNILSGEIPRLFARCVCIKPRQKWQESKYKVHFCKVTIYRQDAWSTNASMQTTWREGIFRCLNPQCQHIAPIASPTPPFSSHPILVLPWNGWVGVASLPVLRWMPVCQCLHVQCSS